MKLSITQAILGVIIILNAVYITGWMIHESPSQLRQPMPDNNGGVTYVDVVPADESLFNVSRYGSYALPVLGVAALVIGVIQSVKADARKKSLFTIYVIAGLLIAVLAAIITRWGYPTEFHTFPGGGSNTIIFTNPGRSLLGVQSASGLMVAFGLAVLGCGITQLVLNRKK